MSQKKAGRGIGFDGSKALSRLTNKLISKLGIRNASADVFLLSGAEMRRVKQRYTGKPAPRVVDVLSFPEPKRFPRPKGAKKTLGEVYINEAIARRDGSRAAYLLVHGILHLLGYTHDRKSDTLRMEKKERELLAKISNY
ncbi:MAG: rRNA maturation RNase YbeY [Patescibacteria group bacterium]